MKGDKQNISPHRTLVPKVSSNTCIIKLFSPFTLILPCISFLGPMGLRVVLDAMFYQLSSVALFVVCDGCVK